MSRFIVSNVVLGVLILYTNTLVSSTTITFDDGIALPWLPWQVRVCLAQPTTNAYNIWKSNVVYVSV